MINALDRIKCDECYGHGVIFYGDNDDYGVEPCECVAQWQGIAKNNYAESPTQKMAGHQKITIEAITYRKKKKKMKLTITSMAGNTSSMELPTKEDVYYFIDLYKSSLKRNQRVKITCDILGIDGYLQGTKPLRQNTLNNKVRSLPM